MARRTTKKRTTKKLDYPLELREAFGLLALENALEAGAAKVGKYEFSASRELANDYELKNFPETFATAFLKGISSASDYLQPAEGWLIRDIINLKRYDDPAQCVGLSMILATFTAEAEENPDYGFDKWVKSWFIDSRRTKTRNTSRNKGGRPRKGCFSVADAEFKKGQIENGFDPDAKEIDDFFA